LANENILGQNRNQNRAEQKGKWAAATFKNGRGWQTSINTLETLNEFSSDINFAWLGPQKTHKKKEKQTKGVGIQG